MTKYFILLALLMTLSMTLSMAVGHRHKGKKHHHNCNGTTSSEEMPGVTGSINPMASSPPPTPVPAALVKNSKTIANLINKERIRRSKMIGGNSTDSSTKKQKRRRSPQEETPEQKPNEPFQFSMDRTLNVSVLHRPQRSPHDTNEHRNHDRQGHNHTLELPANITAESRQERSPQMPEFNHTMDQHRPEFNHTMDQHRPQFNHSMEGGPQSRQQRSPQMPAASIDEHRPEFNHTMDQHRPQFNHSIGGGQQFQSQNRETREVLKIDTDDIVKPVKEILNKTLDAANHLLKIQV